MHELTCPDCQRGVIRPLSARGRRFPHRQFGELLLDEEIAIPTCDACGAEWLDGPSTRQLDEALEMAARAVLRRRAEESIESLRKHLPQRDLERLLGLSPGLLSKVKNGKDTSAPLTAVLMLLAQRPHRLDELRLLWRGENPGTKVVEIESCNLRTRTSGRLHLVALRKLRSSRRS